MYLKNMEGHLKLNSVSYNEGIFRHLQLPIIYSTRNQLLVVQIDRWTGKRLPHFSLLFDLSEDSAPVDPSFLLHAKWAVFHGIIWHGVF